MPNHNLPVMPVSRVKVSRAKQIILLGEPRLLDLAQSFSLWQQLAVVSVAEPSNLGELLMKHAPEEALVISLSHYLDTTLLTWLDSFCEQAGVPWVSFHLEQGIGWLGPLILPDQTANYRDLLVRRLGVAANQETYHALQAPPLAVIPGLSSFPPPLELIWMLSIFGAELERWLAGGRSRLLGAELEANPLRLVVTHYSVLPLPNRSFNGAQPVNGTQLVNGARPMGRLPEVDRLLNDRSGIILRTLEVTHSDFVPATLKTVQAHTAYMAWHYPGWYPDPVSGGSSFDSLESARWAALGEAVERYCGSYLPFWFEKNRPDQPVKATYNDLIAQGEYAVNPERLILFSDEVYQTPGYPFVPFTRDLPVYWVNGRSLTQNRAAWLPLSMVYSHWRHGEFCDVPLTHGTYYPGIAAGPTLEAALLSGIEELVERDATMIWWLNRQPLPALALTPELKNLWVGQPTSLGQRAWLIPLPNEFNLPVLAGVVENVKTQLMCIGFACRADPVQAGLKAWSEALTLEETALDLLKPDNRTAQAIAAGWLPDVLKPWRTDRAYLDSYQSDFSDVGHLLMQLQVSLDPRAVDRIRSWVDMPPNLTLADLPRSERSLASYQATIEARGYELFYANLTTPDVAAAGFTVVRVIIPGLTPNTPAAFPPTGNGRVQNMAVQLGWRSSPLAETELNRMPMPHA